ncbi:Ubiquinone biosynthesis hydroxylase, UbiH/UbiF/VisC/COQ6 family [Xenococcus sp. PCC 7305]|uniref:FAD-dependent hydroxylase n=1 Tax=Xenococcus sp. PCC 7305 TaxID=102125 RepID=UPI0002ABB57E|nr:FAD-dependent hydroxylase [Xenococcus sp. PCC 7305]ELS02606.1 Ubiquinone biosynthesis hydroxylase, UbiH/UbiF/VisC/COQ6 family [Xenococcus sp. PCC 7305]
MTSKSHNNQAMTSYDIAIAGGGIVGITLAAILKNSGLKVIIIEAKPLAVAAARTQAYAFSLLSSRIYEGIGVWQDIVPHIGKFKRIRLSDSDFSQTVQFETTDLNTDYLGYVAQHNVVSTALQKYLADCPNIDWLCPGEVTNVIYQEQIAQVSVRTQETEHLIEAKLVIGADGVRSHLRSLAKITTRGWKYWQSCVAFTIKHTAAQNDTAFERFWSTGPMGVLPLPGNRCQIVWTNPHERAKKLQALSEEEFLEELTHYTQGSLGDLTLISDRVIFPVQLMQCDRYVQSRLALIGDAAHCCHPVGGQGLNLGIRDAASLAQILIAAHDQGQDIGSLSVLKKYETWRKQENLAILGFTDFLDRFFSNDWLPIVIIRRLGLWLMSNLRPLKIFALQLMAGLKGRTPKLAQNN